MRRDQVCYWTLGMTVALGASGARAAVIDDASFFDDIPHTLIEFETRDDGTPLKLQSGDIIFAPLNEYANVGFVAFGMNIAWAYDTGSDVQDALAIGGSPTNNLFMIQQGSGNHGFGFVDDQHSVGFFITMNNSVGIDPPTITAVTRDGQAVGVEMFTGSLVDGTIGVIDYGYIGITSEIGFAGILFDGVHGFTIDEFRFSTVPAPGGALFAVPFLIASSRRRCA